MLDVSEQSYTTYQDLGASPLTEGEGRGLKKYYIIGGLIGLAAMMLMYAIYPEVHHWSFLVITLCCLVLSPVVFSWMAGGRDTFDPLAAACLVLLQLLVVTPLIHLITNQYVLMTEADNRTMLGKTAAMCLIGLVPFFLGYRIRIGERLGAKFFGRPAEVSISRLRYVIAIMLVISIVAKVYLRVMYAGTFEWETRQSWGSGKGVLMMLGDMVCPAVLLWVTYKIILKREQTDSNLGFLARMGLGGTFFIAISVILVTVGLRGSRSLILIHLMWAVGIYHFTVKRVRAATLLIAFICLIPVLHFYSLYKSYGPSALRGIFDPVERSRMEESAGRSFMGTITGDVGRMDVWMFMKQEIDSGRYPMQWGRTYCMAMVTLVPRAIWPTRPYGINEVITDMQSGKGTYAAMYQKSTRIAGMPGEAYANFGFVGVMFMFFVWGVIIKLAKSIVDRWRWDPLLSFLLVPLLYFAVGLVMGNSDVFVQNFVRFLAPPVLAVWYSRMKVYNDGYYPEMSGN